MESHHKPSKWETLASLLQGGLHTDKATRMLYATDASVYRKLPAAVAIPQSDSDLMALVAFASENKMPLIPRTAGTSLAGQCVGEGLVVDFSRHFSTILEINQEEGWVRVQPGVIRDELNRQLAPLGLFFSPNTSSASRCMIGGMVGNNSCGTTSIKYGTTRDKVLELEVILSDGSTAVLGAKSASEIQHICSSDTFESAIYRQVIDQLMPPEVQAEIRAQFPKASIHRRNTGYAVDVLLDHQPFLPKGEDLNLAKLIAGSEGTLCLITSVKIQVDVLPPPFEAVICAHFESLAQTMKATVVAMKCAPYACELMDKAILDCTLGNIEQAENRFFIEGDPGAILAIEVRSDTPAGLEVEISNLISNLQSAGLGYSFPVVRPPDSARVWTLRAAGLGVLSNMPGPAKPIAFVEDTAVDVNDLPAYIESFESLMTDFGQRAVYFAHAGAGELHIRPVLNLKTQDGQDQFHRIGEASARLVKKFNGSLSGEHGDGRVRAEFIPIMIGEENYDLLKRIKRIWDPNGIFNPGKITDAPSMKADLRYKAGQEALKMPTFLDFTAQVDILQAAEACNGSGDCRKLHTTGATMCPSYQATRNEKDSTRARANTFREILTNPANPAYPLDSAELHDVLDLCLSCKACKRECPSSVDMAMLKAEATYHYNRRHGMTQGARFFGNFHKHAAIAGRIPAIANGLLKVDFFRKTFKKRLGIASARSIPAFSSSRATAQIRHGVSRAKAEMVLYIDEFTQYQDAKVATASALVLHKLGFAFNVVYLPSARALISKGMLDEARAVAKNVLTQLQWAIERELPIVGLEPSAILGFRDEFPKLVPEEAREAAKSLSMNAVTFEEFLSRHIVAKRIDGSLFTEEANEVHVHLHCHQKALSQPRHSIAALSLPKNYSVKIIPSGCCGMAGSFGYEEKHYEVSMQIGELVLFPHIRNAAPDVIFAAAGTSCRHQIADGVSKKALHPAEILAAALR